ncbi:hypothetical protein JXA88_11145 [Candidatus Fermentibacteria bacterium]|nr:hypothetical protein [Candidatus Fermentibacteria bacterium]
MGIVTTDSMNWWPPGVEEVLGHSPVTTEGRERGLGCVVVGELTPGTPGVVWHGLPLEWYAELGGDISPMAGAACAELRTGRVPPWMGSGSGTIRVEPWEAVVASPLTGVQVLRGDHNDRSYGVGLSTGVSTSVFSLFSVALSKGDGARTNADYSRTQYDLRLDLRLPVVDACRITIQRGSLDRGDPGPDPRLWPDDGTGDPRSPWFWVSQQSGARDAMWLDDRESIDRTLLALQLDVPLRRRPLSAVILEEELDVERVQSVPIMGDQPVRRIAQGDLRARRRALVSRVSLVAADEESLWAGLSLEHVTRDVHLAWSEGDSAWTESLSDELRRVRAGVGFGLPGIQATFTATNSPWGTAFSWGGTAERSFGALVVDAGMSATAEERRLEDLWEDRLAGGDTSPRPRGTLGSAWLEVARESVLGSITAGIAAGWGREVWGWCQDENLAPGAMRRWGPVSTTATGVTAAWYAAPARGVEIGARARVLPWRVGDDPLARWPETMGAGTVTLQRAIGRAATPKINLTVKYVGTRHAGEGGTLALDPYWQVDGHAAVEIGDFVLRLVVENLTGARHEEERGYSVDGLRFRAGFTWLFWD